MTPDEIAAPLIRKLERMGYVVSPAHSGLYRVVSEPCPSWGTVYHVEAEGGRRVLERRTRPCCEEVAKALNRECPGGDTPEANARRAAELLPGCRNDPVLAAIVRAIRHGTPPDEAMAHALRLYSERVGELAEQARKLMETRTSLVIRDERA